MTTTNRAALFTKTFKVLKKHYRSVTPPSDRTAFEHLLYACCLENTQHEKADEVFAKLQELYFDWNEVRVTTINELAGVMTALPDPRNAASRLKRCLQALFETHYAFDIEFLKKQNIGKAAKQLEEYDGMTPFVIAYVTQNALAGHAIATNSGAIHALVVLGVLSEQQAKKKRVPGMERAIAKNRGVEFGSLLHQLGADFAVSPFGTRVRGILLEIAPDAKERLPKRAPPQKPAAKEAPKKKTSPPAAPAKAKEKKTVKKTKSAASSAAKPKKKTTAKSSKRATSTGKKKSASARLARKKPR